MKLSGRVLREWTNAKNKKGSGSGKVRQKVGKTEGEREEVWQRGVPLMKHS